jgi:hypothetical protein
MQALTTGRLKWKQLLEFTKLGPDCCALWKQRLRFVRASPVYAHEAGADRLILTEIDKRHGT